MRFATNSFKNWALVWILGGLSLHVQADIFVGQVAGFTGPVATGVLENALGADIYLKYINEQGGIKGERIQRISADDQFDPTRSVGTASALIKRYPLVSLILSRGTPNSEALIPWLQANQIPLVAPSTGAMSLRSKAHRFVFNVRSTYRSEMTKLVEQLQTLGFQKIAVIAPNDSFGDDALTGLDEKITKAELIKVFNNRFKKTDPQFNLLSPALKAANPDAIIFLGSAEAVSSGVKTFKEVGIRAQFATLSNNASSGFIKLVGSAGTGMLVMQSFPDERSHHIAVCKEFRAMAKSQGITDITPSMFEGYLAAKVLVAGLQMAGANPTGLKLAKALENIEEYDLGGISVHYGKSINQGINWSNAAMINSVGKFLK